MQQFVEAGDVRKQVQRLNQCRMYLQITAMSDMTSDDGEMFFILTLMAVID